MTDPRPDPAASTAFAADPVRMRDRYAERLRGEGLEHPVVAATIAALRGTAGETTEEFAERMEVPPAAVLAAEAGLLALEELPDPLRFAIRGFDHRA